MNFQDNLLNVLLARERPREAAREMKHRTDGANMRAPWSPGA